MDIRTQDQRLRDFALDLLQTLLCEKNWACIPPGSSPVREVEYVDLTTAEADKSIQSSRPVHTDVKEAHKAGWDAAVNAMKGDNV